MSGLRFLLLPTVVLTLVACAGTGPQEPDESDEISRCEAWFERLDRATRHGAGFDPRFARIDGFRHLRIDRFHAAIAPALATDLQRWQWMMALAELDARARGSESVGRDGAEFSEGTQTRTAACRDRLIERDLTNPDRFSRLLERAKVPDDYSLTARTFGLYPLALPFLKLGVSRYQSGMQDRLQNFSGNSEVVPEHAVIWVPDVEKSTAPVRATEIRALYDNPLRIPTPGEALRRRLLRQFAPRVVVHGDAPFDQPVRPSRDEGRLSVHEDSPVVFGEVTHARVRGRNLMQLVYTMWFSARPPAQRLDLLAGNLDAVIWRVTLDESGRPQVFDSVHACGCYHVIFPIGEPSRSLSERWYQEPLLVAPALAAVGPNPEVHVESGTHYVLGVTIGSESAAGRQREYQIEPWEVLTGGRSLQQRLFDNDERISGTERGERWFLWVTGVRSPGAMRSLGRHAIAFVGRRHFDDPGLLEAFVH